MSECEYCKAIGETMLVGGNGRNFCVVGVAWGRPIANV